MKPTSFRAKFRSKGIGILLFTQLAILVLIYLYARTQFLWIWSTISFIPALTSCLLTVKKWHALLSLTLLFISQQAIFVFANPSWGFSYGSDQINDCHTRIHRQCNT